MARALLQTALLGISVAQFRTKRRRATISIPAACLFETSFNAVTKPFSQTDENVLKQRGRYTRLQQQGTATMQFILNLIWEQSRSSYLAALAEREES